MGLAHEVGKKIGKALAPLHAGDDKLASHKLEALDKRTLDVTSPAFTDGGTLPLAFTADGKGIAPPIAWTNVPSGTRSLVLLAEDPDAPKLTPFVHWLVFGLPPAATSIATARAGTYHEGQNSTLQTGYTPAAPPAGHGLHHYHFQVFALDTALELDDDVGRTELLDAMRNHVLAWGEIVATYERS